jgi:hypothetical protein
MAAVLNSNVTRALNKFDNNNLPEVALLYTSKLLNVYRFLKYKNCSHSFTVPQLYVAYYTLVRETLYEKDVVNAEEYILSNPALIKSKKYHSQVLSLIDEISSSSDVVYISVIHGDLWRDNIIVSDSKMIFIDLDRCVSSSFIEIDLIHFYIYEKIILSKDRSWETFVGEVNELMLSDASIDKLGEFLTDFFEANVLCNHGYDNSTIRNLLRLYVITTIAVNDYYLFGLKAIAWKRNKRLVEKLL